MTLYYATPKRGSIWIEEVVHATCETCGEPLRRHPSIPGITGGPQWFHPSTSFEDHNGFYCRKEKVK